MGKVTGPHSFEEIGTWPDGYHTCRIHLDGMSLKNTILFDLIVNYDGGPLHLVNVKFDFAKFDMADTPNSRRLRAYLLFNTKDNTVTIDLD